MTFTRPPAITHGKVVKAATVSQSLRFNMDLAMHRLAYKPADTNYVNNTLTDDPDLTFQVGANELWYLEMHLTHHSNNARSIRVQWVCPSDAQYRGQAYALWTDATNYLVRLQWHDGDEGNGLIVNDDSWYSTSTIRSVTYYGLLYTVNAGTFSGQFAEVTTDAVPTVLEKGSNIMGCRVGPSPGLFPA